MFRDICRTPLVRDYHPSIQAAAVKRMLKEGWLRYAREEDRYSLNAERVNDALALLRPSLLEPVQEDAEGDQPLDDRFVLSPGREAEMEERMGLLERKLEAALREAREARAAHPTVTMPVPIGYDAGVGEKEFRALKERIEKMAGSLGGLNGKVEELRQLKGLSGEKSFATRSEVDELRAKVKESANRIEDLGNLFRALRLTTMQALQYAYFSTVSVEATTPASVARVAGDLTTRALQPSVDWYKNYSTTKLGPWSHEALLLTVPVVLVPGHCAVCGESVLDGRNIAVAAYLSVVNGMLATVGLNHVCAAHDVNVLYDADLVEDPTEEDVEWMTRWLGSGVPFKPSRVWSEPSPKSGEESRQAAMTRFEAHMKRLGVEERWHANRSQVVSEANGVAKPTAADVDGATKTVLEEGVRAIREGVNLNEAFEKNPKLQRAMRTLVEAAESGLGVDEK